MAESKKVMPAPGAGEAAAPGNKPAAGPRRTKLVDVPQGYIDCLLKGTPLGPFPTLSNKIIDVLRETPQDRVIVRERLRRLQAEIVALAKVVQDEEADILEQYRKYGYAVVEVEVADEEEED